MVKTPRRQPSPPPSSSDEEDPDAHDDEGDHISNYIPSNLGRMVIPYHGDFCVSTIFHPQLIVQLMAEGFLPMAVKTASSSSRDSAGGGGVGCLLLPKLHARRSVIPLNPESALHVSRSVRKKAKHYTLTLNTSWDQVVKYCQEQHGSSCWLYPPLVQAYLVIHKHPMQATVTTTTTNANIMPEPPESAASASSRNHHHHHHHRPQQRVAPTTSKVLVRMYSVELWDVRTNELVAGELGYTVGDFMYTSLTGFTRQDSAGSVQLAAWGRFLQQQQYAIWDLGMDMAYKKQLGAQEWPRKEFVQFVHTHRAMPCPSNSNDSAATASSNPLLEALQQPVNCQQILQPAEAKGTTVTTTTTATSKGKKPPAPSPSSAVVTTTNLKEAPLSGDVNHKETDSPCSKKRSRSSSATKSTSDDDASTGKSATLTT